MEQSATSECLCQMDPQAERHDLKGLSIVVKPQDYRRKAREKRIGAYQLFVVDCQWLYGSSPSHGGGQKVRF